MSSQKGRKVTWGDKISKTKKRLVKEGKFVPWNKGKTYEELWGKKKAKEFKKKISKSNKGKTPWIKGKKGYWKPNKKQLKKIRDARKGKTNPFYGRSHSRKTKLKIGKATSKRFENKENTPWFGKNRIGIMKEKNPNWAGGKSFEPYGQEFNDKLKEYIRNKYDRICQECYQKERVGRKLDVHHIDYNKKNNKEENLIPLHQNCHRKTQSDRKKWTKHFQKKINTPH